MNRTYDKLPCSPVEYECGGVPGPQYSLLIYLAIDSYIVVNPIPSSLFRKGKRFDLQRSHSISKVRSSSSEPQWPYTVNSIVKAQWNRNFSFSILGIGLGSGACEGKPALSLLAQPSASTWDS